MNETDPTLYQVSFAVITILGAVNAFFIKGLVNKIDKADKGLSRYEEQIRQLKEQVEKFSVIIEEISDLKSEVAVLKYAAHQRGKGE